MPTPLGNAPVIRAADGDAAIAAAIEAQVPGRALDQIFYRDAALFERDMERIFMRHWLCAGHESSLAKPGDYLLYELGAESVIVIRAEDGHLRALVNVCRHRGSRICKEATGDVKFLVCPYHAWSYGLDGLLRAALHMPEGVHTASYGRKD